MLEREPQVGGMAASFIENSDGEYWSYDFGPHRFHTTDPELIEHVSGSSPAITGAPRGCRGSTCSIGSSITRCKPGTFLRNLPPRVLVRSFVDYFAVRFTERMGITHYSDDNFEGWVVKRFGRTLYELFFGRYTGKAWKMAPEDISGDWASQRISLLNLSDTVKKTLAPVGFDPAHDWCGSSCIPIGAVSVRSRAGTYASWRRWAPPSTPRRPGHPGALPGSPGRSRWTTEAPEPGSVEADDYISTIPITSLARAVRPGAPDAVREALSRLRYVSIVFVYLKVNKPHVSPDSWVYLPERELTVHRISEFKNFSPNCAPPEKDDGVRRDHMPNRRRALACRRRDADRDRRCPTFPGSA